MATRIGYIGTAGRRDRKTGTDDGEMVDRRVYELMYADASERAAAVAGEKEGVSGGAAVADQLTVRLYLDNRLDGLRLHLPAEFDLRSARFREDPSRGSFDPGRTANYYHDLFKRRTGIDGLGELRDAILKGAVVPPVPRGTDFKARNTLVANEADILVAYTFGPLREVTVSRGLGDPGYANSTAAGVKDGGTADTWGKASRAREKIHVPVWLALEGARGRAAADAAYARYAAAYGWGAAQARPAPARPAAPPPARATAPAAPAPAAVGRPAPALSASMYFSYGASKRPGVRAASTFEAIDRGERTSTTRFDSWAGTERWARLQPGAVVRFHEDREMKGRAIDVVIESVRRVDLARCPEDELEAWSRREGWTPQAGREYGRKSGLGWQIVFRDPQRVGAWTASWDEAQRAAPPVAVEAARPAADLFSYAAAQDTATSRGPATPVNAGAAAIAAVAAARSARPTPSDPLARRTLGGTPRATPRTAAMPPRPAAAPAAQPQSANTAAAAHHARAGTREPFADDTMIAGFDGEYRWLSNFWPARVTLDGVVYPTVEHAYQAAKTLDAQARLVFSIDPPAVRAPDGTLRKPSVLNAGEAKRRGKTLTLRPDWEQVKFSVMEDLIEQKYERPDLAAKLLATQGRAIVELNRWGDRTFGQDPLGRGANRLGDMIVAKRERLLERERAAAAPQRAAEIDRVGLERALDAFEAILPTGAGAAAVPAEAPATVEPAARPADEPLWFASIEPPAQLSNLLVTGSRAEAEAALPRDEHGSPVGWLAAVEPPTGAVLTVGPSAAIPVGAAYELEALGVAPAGTGRQALTLWATEAGAEDGAWARACAAAGIADPSATGVHEFVQAAEAFHGADRSGGAVIAEEIVAAGPTELQNIGVEFVHEALRNAGYASMSYVNEFDEPGASARIIVPGAEARIVEVVEYGQAPNPTEMAQEEAAARSAGSGSRTQDQEMRTMAEQDVTAASAAQTQPESAEERAARERMEKIRRIGEIATSAVALHAALHDAGVRADNDKAPAGFETPAGIAASMREFEASLKAARLVTADAEPGAPADDARVALALRTLDEAMAGDADKRKEANEIFRGLNRIADSANMLAFDVAEEGFFMAPFSDPATTSDAPAARALAQMRHTEEALKAYGYTVVESDWLERTAQNLGIAPRETLVERGAADRAAAAALAFLEVADRSGLQLADDPRFLAQHQDLTKALAGAHYLLPGDAPNRKEPLALQTPRGSDEQKTAILRGAQALVAEIEREGGLARVGVRTLGDGDAERAAVEPALGTLGTALREAGFDAAQAEPGQVRLVADVAEYTFTYVVPGQYATAVQNAADRHAEMAEPGAELPPVPAVVARQRDFEAAFAADVEANDTRRHSEARKVLQEVAAADPQSFKQMTSDYVVSAQSAGEAVATFRKDLKGFGLDRKDIVVVGVDGPEFSLAKMDDVEADWAKTARRAAQAKAGLTAKEAGQIARVLDAVNTMLTQGVDHSFIDRKYRVSETNMKELTAALADLDNKAAIDRMIKIGKGELPVPGITTEGAEAVANTIKAAKVAVQSAEPDTEYVKFEKGKEVHVEQLRYEEIEGLQNLNKMLLSDQTFERLDKHAQIALMERAHATINQIAGRPEPELPGAIGEDPRLAFDAMVDEQKVPPPSLEAAWSSRSRRQPYYTEGQFRTLDPEFVRSCREDRRIVSVRADGEGQAHRGKERPLAGFTRVTPGEGVFKDYPMIAPHDSTARVETDVKLWIQKSLVGNDGKPNFRLQQVLMDMVRKPPIVTTETEGLVLADAAVHQLDRYNDMKRIEKESWGDKKASVVVEFDKAEVERFLSYYDAAGARTMAMLRMGEGKLSIDHDAAPAITSQQADLGPLKGTRRVAYDAQTGETVTVTKDTPDELRKKAHTVPSFEPGAPIRLVDVGQLRQGLKESAGDTVRLHLKSDRIFAIGDRDPAPQKVAETNDLVI